MIHPSDYKSKSASTIASKPDNISIPCLSTHKPYRKQHRKPHRKPHHKPHRKPHCTQTKANTRRTTMKETHNNPPPIYKYNTLHLLFLTTYYETTTNGYINEFPLYTVPQYITRKQHPSHDDYLYRRWNTPTVRKHKTKKTPKRNQRVLTRSTTKDDTSVTPTLDTLCTIDTTPRQHGNADMLISITILSKPIAQYRMPKRPATRNRSVPDPSIAVQYALIGVYDKLLHPPNVSCLMPTFTRIVCVVLSCFILLADSFTLVKIDDRYPDEWND